MTLKKYILHIVFLFVEFAVFLAVALRSVFVDGDSAPLIHFHCVAAYALTVLGVTSFFMLFTTFLSRLLLDDGEERSFGVKVLMGGLLILGIGCVTSAGRLIWLEYPEFFRMGKPLTGIGRIVSLGGVIVHFDANEGNCMDSIRVVKHDASYSDNVNQYVLDDERNFVDLRNIKINLPRNLFVVSFANKMGRRAYAHYFSTNAIPLISKTEKWSYVVDVESIRGNVSDWYIGQTWSTNYNVYSHLEESRIGSNDGKWRTRVLHVDVCSWQDYNFLDRGVIFVGPGQSLDMSFRVSLFAGTGVNESNYHYVRPGETLACPLPVPTREGYAFEGWYDGDRRITEESKVERREKHTLRAKWRKL